MGPHTYECIKSNIPLDLLSLLKKDPLTFLPREQPLQHHHVEPVSLEGML
jgi:hypothetical protein